MHPIRLVLQTPHQLHCPSLGTRWDLNVFHIVKKLIFFLKIFLIYLVLKGNV